jgi:hypothetical protein
VNRVLKELRDKELAQISERRLTIPDTHALARLVDWDDAYLAPRPIF